MRYLIALFFLLSAAAPSAATGLSTSCPTEKKVVVQPKKHFSKNLSVRRFAKKYRPLDTVALWAVGFAILPLVATLITYLIAGGYAAGFVLLFSSVFSLIGVVLGVVSLTRAILRGWRRGTFWAVVAIAIPLLFLLIASLTG